MQLSCVPAYIAEPAAPLSETKEVNKKPRQPKARSPKQLKAAALPKKQKKQASPSCGSGVHVFFHFLRLEKVESFVQENRGVGGTSKRL